MDKEFWGEDTTIGPQEGNMLYLFKKSNEARVAEADDVLG